MSIANMITWYARKPSRGQHFKRGSLGTPHSPLSSKGDMEDGRQSRASVLHPLLLAIPVKPCPLKLLPWPLQCAKTLGRKLPSPLETFLGLGNTWPTSDKLFSRWGWHGQDSFTQSNRHTGIFTYSGHS